MRDGGREREGDGEIQTDGGRKGRLCERWRQSGERVRGKRRQALGETGIEEEKGRGGWRKKVSMMG